jgi:PRTRC genetic system protein B
MEANIHLGETATFELANAMLIYEQKSGLGGGAKSVAVTVHPVCRQGNKTVIGPGHPITRQAVESLASALGRNLAACWLPPNLVSLSFGQMAWFVPAGRRRIWFKPDGRFDGGAIKDDSETARVMKLNGKFVHHPPLLFVAGGNSLRVVALPPNERPHAQAQIYRAPYWNLWEDGKMCNGNRKLADLPTPASIPAFEDGFFNSAFSHTNIKRVCRHPRGHAALWEELARRKSAPDAAFWRQNLVRLNLTLEKLLQNDAPHVPHIEDQIIDDE